MSKTVLEMAREIWSAGDVYIGPSEKTLELFAELVRADEREACAKLCEELAETEWADNERCAAAIRARENT